MAPNGIPPVGDDLKWKKEVDRQLALLAKQIETLNRQAKSGAK